MGEQKQKSTSKQAQTENKAVGQSEESKAQTAKVQEETDDLLAAIDELLPETEEESQKFVDGYVQKGGQ